MTRECDARVPGPTAGLP